MTEEDHRADLDEPGGPRGRSCIGPEAEPLGSAPQQAHITEWVRCGNK